MNKKIKKVVKNYEEKMKFESRFESLSQKLDLIPDNTPIKSDVIIIKRRMIPAYLMSVIVMALITGIIGLQIGLSNLKLNTIYESALETELKKHLDIFSDYSIYTKAFDEETMLLVYYGSDKVSERLVINVECNSIQGSIKIDYKGQETSHDLSSGKKWVSFPIDKSDDTIVFEFTLTDDYGIETVDTISIEIKTFRLFLYGEK